MLSVESFRLLVNSEVLGIASENLDPATPRPSALRIGEAGLISNG
jgi:hypothetical protein